MPQDVAVVGFLTDLAGGDLGAIGAPVPDTNERVAVRDGTIEHLTGPCRAADVRLANRVRGPVKLAARTAFETGGEALAMLFHAAVDDAGSYPAILPIENGQHHADTDQRGDRYEKDIPGDYFASHIFSQTAHSATNSTSE